MDIKIAVAETESTAARGHGKFSERKVTRLHDQSAHARRPIYTFAGIRFSLPPSQSSSTLPGLAEFSATPYFPLSGQAMTYLESAALRRSDAATTQALADKWLCRDPSRFFPKQRYSFRGFHQLAPTA